MMLFYLCLYRVSPHFGSDYICDGLQLVLFEAESLALQKRPHILPPILFFK